MAEDKNKYILSINGMSKSFGRNKVLKHIDLNVKPGTIMGLMGENGAGKSTMMKCLFGTYQKDEGVIILDGKEVNFSGPKEALENGVAMVHQELNQCLERSVIDNLFLGRYPKNSLGVVDEGRMKKEASDLFRKLGITVNLTQPMKRMSVSKRQMCEIAKAISYNSKIIVLDEPTSFLDIRHKLELLTILKQMVLDHQLTVIMSLHELDLAQKISDKVICVHGEYIEKYGAPEEIFTSEYIRKLYGITRGSYNAAFGCVEMDPPRGEPQVFVIGGNGSGIPYYRKLQRQGIPFAAGVLHTNDVDCQVAGALADQVITEKPFESISQESYDKAVKLMKKCQKVICPLKDFGTVNAANRELLRLARELGILAEL